MCKEYTAYPVNLVGITFGGLTIIPVWQIIIWRSLNIDAGGLGDDYNCTTYGVAPKPSLALVDVCS